MQIRPLPQEPSALQTLTAGPVRLRQPEADAEENKMKVQSQPASHRRQPTFSTQSATNYNQSIFTQAKGQPLAQSLSSLPALISHGQFSQPNQDRTNSTIGFSKPAFYDNQFDRLNVSETSSPYPNNTFRNNFLQ